MPTKYFDDQLDDEEVLFVFRKHPVVMRRGLVYAMIAILLGTIPSLIKPEYVYLFGGLGAGFLLSLIVFAPAWIGWYYSVYIVTDQRLIQISQKGLWARSIVDIALPQIQMVNYEVKGLQETLLGYGTQKKILTILRDKGILNTPPPMAEQGAEAE